MRWRSPGVRVDPWTDRRPCDRDYRSGGNEGSGPLVERRLVNVTLADTPMPPANWMYYVPVLALLIWAAVEDARARRIPNWITFSLALAGLANAFLTGQPLGPTAAMLGFLTGFALGFVLFGLGAVGGGDVK